MDSVTTSTFSAPATVMPYSVSRPNTRFIPRGDKLCGGSRYLPSLLDYTTAVSRLALHRADGRNLDDILRIVINELEPIFGNVSGREDIVLAIFGIEGKLQVSLSNALLLLGRNGAFYRQGFSAL